MNSIVNIENIFEKCKNCFLILAILWNGSTFFKYTSKTSFTLLFLHPLADKYIFFFTKCSINVIRGYVISLVIARPFNVDVSIEVSATLNLSQCHA